MDILVDIDGTLADARHRLHFIAHRPKDWTAFFDAMADDPPILEMIEMVRTLGREHRLLLVTGRPETHRRTTETWLDRQGISYDALLMRARDDRRPDQVVKVELLQVLRQRGYDPKLAFEDRGHVAAAFRAAGLRVAQIEPDAT